MCRGIQNRLWQNQAIGRDHGRIGIEGRKFLPALLRFSATPASAPSRPRSSAVCCTAGCHQLFPPARRARGLRIDRDNVVAGGVQRLEGRDRKIRGSHEDQTHKNSPCVKLPLGRRENMSLKTGPWHRKRSKIWFRPCHVFPVWVPDRRAVPSSIC